jgi:benzoyl-CoA reductase/2-hydroxyglutaryl-CoA dehydratase subunit BcrC/BadD/HgdB
METGERTMPRDFHRQRLNEDPFLELADAYFGHIPDAFRRPNSELYRWMKREFDSRDVRGLILVRKVWCDLWHGESARLRDWLDIPFLDLDLDGKNSRARNKNRIQSFMEVIR